MVGMYVPPLLEELGLTELEHNARNNRIRPLQLGCIPAIFQASAGPK